jgi:hypothetical protein
MNYDAQLVLTLIVLAAIFFAIGGFLVWLLWGWFWDGFDWCLERYTRWKHRRFECRVGHVYHSSPR